MKREELIERQKNILNQLHELFKNLEMETELSTASENGIADILITEHQEVGMRGDEVLGEYYFLPDPAPEQAFSSLVMTETILDDMTPEHAPDVVCAISRLNLLLPMGAFVVDEESGTVSYRNTVLLRAEDSEDGVFEMVRYGIAVALEIVHRWMDPLMSLAYGNIEFKDFLEILATPFTDGQA